MSQAWCSRVVAMALLLLSALAPAYSIVPPPPPPSGPFIKGSVTALKPSPTRSVDQSLIYNGIYYLADRTNAVIQRVDISTGSLLSPIGNGSFAGFQNNFCAGGCPASCSCGNSLNGPNGLTLVTYDGKVELWAGDSPSRIQVISLASNTIVATISTGPGLKRCDELAYSAFNGRVVAANPEDPIPFVTMIDVRTRKVLDTMYFPWASDGLEQPVYNKINKLMYQQVPLTEENDHGGEIAVLNTAGPKLVMVKRIGEPYCNAKGLVFGNNGDLFLGCNADSINTPNAGDSHLVILDAASGKTKFSASGVAGSDQVAFDPKRNLFFAACYQYLDPDTLEPEPVLAIVCGATGKLLQIH